MSIYEFTSQIFYHSGRWSDYESTFSIKKLSAHRSVLISAKGIQSLKKTTAALTVL